MNLLFTVNRDYIGHVMDCIRSIVRFYSEGGYDIYIMHSDLQKEDQEFLSQKLENHRYNEI